MVLYLRERQEMIIHKNKIIVVLIAIMLVLATLCLCLYWQGAITVSADTIKNIKANDELTRDATFTLNGEKTKASFSATNGGEFVAKFDNKVNINRIVLEEKTSTVESVKIYVDGKEIYSSDFIGKFKYCAFDMVNTDEIKIIFVAEGNFKIKDIRLFTVVEKSSYSLKVLDDITSETVNDTTAVIVKDIVTIDKHGDVIVNAEKLNAIKALNKNFNMIMDIGINPTEEMDELAIFKQCWDRDKFKVVSGLVMVLRNYNFGGYNLSFDFPNGVRKGIYSEFALALSNALQYNIICVTTDVEDMQFSEKTMANMSCFNVYNGEVNIANEKDVFNNLYDQYESLLSWGMQRRLTNFCLTVDGYEYLSAQGQRDLKAFVSDFNIKGIVIN